MRGVKKAIEALEELFETGKKPTEEHFFDLLASFYHKDEDISFLINIAKATVTDAQVAENNDRFMTALRTYQSILWWVRLAKLPLLNTDIQELITANITDFYNNTLMAVSDGDTTINTLGELIQAFQGFQEQTGGIDSLRGRIAQLEKLLDDVPDNLRQVQNTFDSLQGQVSNAQSSANNAQSTADLGVSLANTAQGTADSAVGLANTAQGKADFAFSKAMEAIDMSGLGRANDAFDFASNNFSRIAALEYRVDALENP